jgi:formamidopyrimidine-DNA glycosylase
MPEGPEILLTAQYLNKCLLNKEIGNIEVLSGRYVKNKLVGLNKLVYPLKVLNVSSKGKFLWFNLVDNNSEPVYLMNTFGLTGMWTNEFDEYSRVRIDLVKSDKSYYYSDMIGYGTLKIVFTKKELDKQLNKLAPDILQSNMSASQMVELIEDFIKNTKKRDTNIVKVLMDDQGAILSGIGNYLIAEILYDAKINPHRNIDELNEQELKNLVKSIRKVTKNSYVNGATEYTKHFKKEIYEEYFKDVKITKTFNFKVYKQEKDPKGNKVIKDTIIKGRTIHWVKSVQI